MGWFDHQTYSIREGCGSLGYYSYVPFQLLPSQWNFQGPPKVGPLGPQTIPIASVLSIWMRRTWTASEAWCVPRTTAQKSFLPLILANVYGQQAAGKTAGALRLIRNLRPDTLMLRWHRRWVEEQQEDLELQRHKVVIKGTIHEHQLNQRKKCVWMRSGFLRCQQHHGP